MKNIYANALAFLVLATFVLPACSEIFSPDISDEAISLNSPADSLFTDEAIVSFWWEDLEKAEKYEMQLVTPDFFNPTLLLDTLFVDNQLSVELDDEGIYAWRVRGKNEGSETPWVERTFILDQTAPYLPSGPNHHQDTISASAVDSLTWFSSDAPVGGVTFGVSDSVYVSRANDSLSFLFNAFIPFGEIRSIGLDVLNDLEGPGTYFWRITSVDRAGNRRQGAWFKFVVQ